MQFYKKDRKKKKVRRNGKRVSEMSMNKLDTNKPVFFCDMPLSRMVEIMKQQISTKMTLSW